MPDATPTSIAPRSPARQSKRWLIAKIAITAIVLGFVGRALLGQWQKFRQAPAVDLHPRWASIALSCVVVFATYAILIETWRRMVLAWGEDLPFGDAASMWFVSNLVRYVPSGQVLQLGALAGLARRRQVSPAVAAGASLINVAVNIATGFIVALVGGFTALDTLSGGHAAFGVWAAGILLVSLLALPNVLPWLLVIFQRVTGRDLAVGALPRRAIYISLVGNVLAWATYGLAFELFVRGVLGRNVGTASDYIAVWAGAYVIGYLAFLLPAGAGVREIAMTDGLGMLYLANVGEAGVIAIAARLWLTALEILPAFLFMARNARSTPQANTPRDGSLG
ncbi:MAG TPA: hypothetical protein VII52_10535 [Gemmatimonadaceae bacterium]